MKRLEKNQHSWRNIHLNKDWDCDLYKMTNFLQLFDGENFQDKPALYSKVHFDVMSSQRKKWLSIHTLSKSYIGANHKIAS